VDVRDLAMVEAIVETGTLTRAAARLHLTQSAISYRLAQLERRTRSRLFNRSSSRLEPTVEGRRLLQSARVVLRELHELEADLERLRNGVAGQIRVATECHITYHWLPRVVARFSRSHPDIDVVIAPEATRDPIPALREDRIDLAVVYHTDTVPDDVSLRELFCDELIALSAPELTPPDRDYLEASDFAAATQICHYAEPDRSVLDRFVLQPSGVRPRRVLEMQVTPAVIEMVRAGLGITVVPRWVLGPGFDARGLTVLRVTREGLHRRWYAAVRAERAASTPLNVFIDLLREHGPAR
jgi:LysR family transcriptional regulator for metE and metH